MLTYDHNKKTLFCIMGKSSSGKDSIKKKLLEKDDRLVNMVPFTTRPMRDGEVNGIDYNFITNDDYLNMKNIIESRIYNIKKSDGSSDTWIYGHNEPENGSIFLMIGTFESYRVMIDKSMNDNSNYNIIPIYIEISDEERLYRLIMRETNVNKEPNFRELARRYTKDNEDFSLRNLQILGISDACRFCNDILDDCVNEIHTFIKSFIDKED